MKKVFYALTALGMFAALIVAGCSGTSENPAPQDVLTSGGKNSVVYSQAPFTGNQNGCANGGISVETGIDKDADGILDANEVDSTKTQYVCNGAPGTAGTAGAKGDKGDTGDTGSGLNAAVTMTDEATCEFGGKKISVGVDTDKDGILDAGEVTSSTVVCFPADESVSSIRAIDGGYIGTDACLGCHENKESFLKSGHPYKYTHTGGQVPTGIPSLFTRPGVTDNSYINTVSLNSALVADGNGLLDWSAVNYTVGGFGWKIRWGVKSSNTSSTGYVWAGNKAQLNIRDGSWSKYPGTVPYNKKYECAVCHNTNGIVSTKGYSCETDGGSDILPARTQPWAKNPGMGPETHGGYYSSWTFDGVQCEACHGPGVNHAKLSTSQGVLTLGVGVEICAKCHIRAENTAGSNAECGGDSNTKHLTNGATASGDWIGHHEQYNELVGYNGDGAHASLKCTTCHDPHKRSTKVVDAVATYLGITDNNQSAEARGAIRKSCTDCHVGKTPQGAGSGMTGLACIDCHMAEVTKSASAASSTGWGRKGDVKTHIFRIDPAGTTIIRTNADGKSIATNAITLKYACGKCHGLTGTATAVPQSYIDRATNYHGTN